MLGLDAMLSDLSTQHLSCSSLFALLDMLTVQKTCNNVVSTCTLLLTTVEARLGASHTYQAHALLRVYVLVHAEIHCHWQATALSAILTH